MKPFKTIKQKNLTPDALLEFMRVHVQNPLPERKIQWLLRTNNYRWANFRNVVTELRKQGISNIIANRYGYFYTSDESEIAEYLFTRHHQLSKNREVVHTMLYLLPTNANKKEILKNLNHNQPLI